MAFDISETPHHHRRGEDRDPGRDRPDLPLAANPMEVDRHLSRRLGDPRHARLAKLRVLRAAHGAADVHE